MKFITFSLYSIAAVLSIFPIYLYIIGVFECQSHIAFLKERFWQWGLIGLGVIGILIIIWLMRQKDVHDFNNFWGELKYLFTNGKPAWILGLAISNIIIAFYFFIPSLSHVDRFGTSFTIYIGVLVIFLGIHYLYEKEAPLIGTMSLLEKLNKDLDNFKGGYLYFVFPALNFGFYTEAIINGKKIFGPQNGSYTFFEKTSLAADLGIKLNDIKTRKSIQLPSKSKAIIYKYDANENYLNKLYAAYHYMISEEEKCQKYIQENKISELKGSIEALYQNEAVINCVESAKLISSIFEEKAEIKPNEFIIQPIIVIGNIVYMIADYGMPIYDEDEKFFVPLKNEGQPIELICWRRTDAVLAQQIVNHIDRFIKTKG